MFSIIATWRFDNWEKLIFSECQSLPISRNSVFTHDSVNQKNFKFNCSIVTRLFTLMDCSPILPYVNQLLRERKSSTKITLINNVPKSHGKSMQMDESPTTSFDMNTDEKCNTMPSETTTPVTQNVDNEKTTLNDATLCDQIIVISDDNEDVRKPSNSFSISTSPNKQNFTKTEITDLKNEQSGSFVLGTSPRSADESTSSLRKLFVFFFFGSLI